MFALNRNIHLRILMLLAICFLLGIYLSQLTWAQSDWVVLFEDDFENGIADVWYLELGWEVERENGNYVLSASEKGYSRPIVDGWSNYSFKCDIKIIEGDCVNLNYRKIEDGGRYFIGFKTDGISLGKTKPFGNHIRLVSLERYHQLGRWYVVEIVGVENNIKVYVDGIKEIDYTDSDPVDWGTFGLIVPVPNSHVHFDNIVVRGEKPPTPTLDATWIRTNGPYGGIGYDIRIDPTNPDILYVTDTFGGVYKTTDGAKTWKAINNGIITRAGTSKDQIPIFCLTIDPSNPSILWAGTLRGKAVYKSTNGGETWALKFEGINTEGFSDSATLSIRDFAVDPYNSDVVFATGEIEDFFDGEFKSVGVIYKTTDGGDHWTKVCEATNLFRPVDIDPHNTDVVYATTGIRDRRSVGLEGAFKSEDGGRTWRKINDGIEDLVLGFLDRDPSNSKKLYAASGRDSNNGLVNGSVYKTTDGGKHWQKTLRTDSPVTVVAVAPSDSNMIYAGINSCVFRSKNGGVTWKKLGFNCPGYLLSNPIGIAVDPYDPYKVYLNGWGGSVYKSIDGGKSWFAAFKGICNAEVFGLDIIPEQPSTIYAAGKTGLFKSEDYGENWEGINYGVLEGQEWQGSVAIDPLNHDIVYCGSPCSGEIYKSSDGGKGWIVLYDFVTINTTDRGYPVKCIEVSKVNSDIIYVGIMSGVIEKDIYATREDIPDYGIFKSIDGGNSWIQVNNGIANGHRHIYDMAVHPTDPDIAYAAVPNIGIYRTTDGGNTWNEKNNGLISVYISVITIDPNNPETIYAGTVNGSGVLKSINGGETWEPTNKGMTLICPSSLLPIGGTVKGISLEGLKLFNLKSSYYQWPWSTITDIVVDPSNSEIVYASDLMFGIYRSDDRGANWARINDGLSMREVSTMAISDDGKILYAGTKGGGVFRLPLENYPPEIVSTFPEPNMRSYTVRIAQGDSVEFGVSAYDINADPLSYSWILDDDLIEGQTGATCLLTTDDLPSGPYLLKVQVADADTFVTATWDVDIVAAP